ncbi:MAG: methyltransferase, partial [Actinobacteria bacterium]|nr:methyltransferase [Actinomycetota bacterium]
MTEAAEEQVGGRASGRLRTSRYAKVLPYLRGSLLEVGCGTSPLVHDFRSSFTSYTGCDLDAELIERLSDRYPEATYEAVDLDHQDLPRDWVSFDTILATAVIEHL